MSVKNASCSRERRRPPGERERRRCAGRHVADAAQLVGGGHRGAGGARRHQPQVRRSIEKADSYPVCHGASVISSMLSTYADISHLMLHS